MILRGEGVQRTSADIELGTPVMATFGVVAQGVEIRSAHHDAGITDRSSQSVQKQGWSIG